MLVRPPSIGMMGGNRFGGLRVNTMQLSTWSHILELEEVVVVEV